MLDTREVFIHPLEYVKSWNDATIKLVTLDFRSANEFEKFHYEIILNSITWTVLFIKNCNEDSGNTKVIPLKTVKVNRNFIMTCESAKDKAKTGE